MAFESHYRHLIKLCEEFITVKSTVFEIGSYKGDRSILFAKYAGAVYCVDPWRDYQDGDKFWSEMVEAEAHFDCQVGLLNNVHKFRATSEVAAKVIGDGTADLVYIDAIKTYSATNNDIKLWWPKVKNGGVLAGHFYGTIGVNRAVDEIFGKADRIYADDSWAVVKSPGRVTETHARRNN